MKKMSKAFIAAMMCFSSLGLVSCGEPAVSSSQETSQNSSQEPSSSLSVAKTYTVTWMVEGKVVEVDEKVPENTMPSYDGATPTKKGNAQYSYTFANWSPELTPVVKDVTYNAIFDEKINSYTVTFNTDGGSVVDSITVDYGTKIDEPTTIPEKEGYKFIGWCLDQAGENPVSWPYEVKGDVTFYAIYNKKINLVQYLEALLDGYSLNPLSYIKDSLLPTYENNLVQEDDINFNFNNFVNTADIPSQGYGEQWAMVVDNLQQSLTFFNVLQSVDAVAASSITIFNNYMDENPSSTAHHSFKVGDYDVIVDFDGIVMSYVLSFTTTIPVIGEVTPQIDLTFNTQTGERVGRIQLSDANALRYEIYDNSYKFAIRYGGVRRAYFDVVRHEDGAVDGNIFEYLGIDGKFATSSCAQFHIDDVYTSVVGNKASGIPGFKGTIVELYETDTGHMLGYEVNEALSIAGIDVNYDTLWFNINDVLGINSVKALEKNPEGEEETSMNANNIYVNGSSDIFVAKEYGGLTLKTSSRRYDIELRSRFYTYFDATSETYYMKEVKVPMFFVQEEKFDDLVNDVKKENPYITNFGINCETSDLETLKTEYDNRLDEFAQAKDDITVEYILDWIGEKITF